MSSLQSFSPTTMCYDKKSNNESIDYDFYDSNFDSGEYETDSDYDEIKEGVKGIQIKPLIKSSKDTDINNDKSFTDRDCDSNLTKCIAFESKDTDCSENGCISKSSSEEERVTPTPVVSPTTISSLSTSTSSPSDLTNITPMSSSSCSSMKDKNDDYHSDFEEESNKLDMKLLQDAVESLSLNKKNTRSPTHSILSRNSCRPRRKNMTFTNEELRKIHRENTILLNKIKSYTKPRPKQISLATNTTPVQIKASAAVNRTRQQRQINHDNHILVKKIQNVKSTQSFINKN